MSAAIVSTIQNFGSSMAAKGQSLLDSFFPPEKRAELLARLKAFVLKNPKVSAFLLTNLALTGGPLALFALFSLSVFIFALIVALVVALLAAVAFTLFAVGVALLILLPTVLFTTFTAVFLFLWGLGGFYIFKYFNKESAPGPKGSTIGDKLNSLTGNNLNFVMDNARAGWVERQLGDSQKEWRAPSAHHAPKQNGSPDATPKKQNAQSEDSAATSGSDAHQKADSPVNGLKSGANGVKKNLNTDNVTNASNGVTKNAGLGDAGDKVKGAPRKLTQAPGTIKGTAVGGIGGATGLA
ncbi:Dilute domain-containing protein [Sphaceloma murrayae]|uniref:Dilute domain-containing protein n=1 Tax=Sphaceloma murrayae TaxID=2082308 RepID=A0A2K1QL63_9PEZI|nr:Dilute domain-containing protein [Sphaceloma murrayae]